MIEPRIEYIYDPKTFEYAGERNNIPSYKDTELYPLPFSVIDKSGKPVKPNNKDGYITRVNNGRTGWVYNKILTDIEQMIAGTMLIPEGMKILDDKLVSKTELELIADGLLTIDEYNNRQIERRRLAYQEKSDPVFFLSQRGLETLDNWKLAIEDIRSRYPKYVGM